MENPNKPNKTHDFLNNVWYFLNIALFSILVNDKVDGIVIKERGIVVIRLLDVAIAIIISNHFIDSPFLVSSKIICYREPILSNLNHCYHCLSSSSWSTEEKARLWAQNHPWQSFLTIKISSVMMIPKMNQSVDWVNCLLLTFKMLCRRNRTNINPTKV